MRTPFQNRNRVIAVLGSRAGLGALLLLAAAAVTFSEVSRLRLGSASAMGPGYFPALLGGLFVVFAALLLFEGWRNPHVRAEPGPLRPVALLLGSIILFALLYRHLGGVIAIAIMVVVSSLAEKRRSVPELLALAAVIVSMVWVIFVWALGLQLNMLPPWLAP